MIINRLTVDGRDFFLPDPVTELKAQILEAIRAQGGYVNIPPIHGGTGIDILFSPGTQVSWTQISMGAESQAPSAEQHGPTSIDDPADSL